MFRKAEPSSKVIQQLHQLSLSLTGSRDGPYRGWFLVQAGRAEQEQHQRNNQKQQQQQQQQQLSIDSSVINAGYFFTCAGRVFASSALHERNEIMYFNAEEFISEAILAFQKSINVCPMTWH